MSVQALIDCVQAGLDDTARAAKAHVEQTAGSAPPTPVDSRAQAIAAHFAGDEGLYDAFRASCLPLFLDDIAQGDAATAAHAAPALRRLGHSLKGVLHSLGVEAAAAEAQALEAAALATDRADLTHCWHALRQRLQALAAAG